MIEVYLCPHISPSDNELSPLKCRPLERNIFNAMKNSPDSKNTTLLKTSTSWRFGSNGKPVESSVPMIPRLSSVLASGTPTTPNKSDMESGYSSSYVCGSSSTPNGAKVAVLSNNSYDSHTPNDHGLHEETNMHDKTMDNDEYNGNNLQCSSMSDDVVGLNTLSDIESSLMSASSAYEDYQSSKGLLTQLFVFPLFLTFCLFLIRLPSHESFRTRTHL